VQVTGFAGVPGGADAVVLNVTATGPPTALSFLTIWPTGQPRPNASSLNFQAGQVIPNAVTVQLGTAGKISLFNLAGNVDVVIDVVGYYDTNAGDGFTSLSPGRILDSRPAGPQVGPFSTPWGGGTSRDVQVTGLAGVPGGADAVVLNVTATAPTASSYLTIWPAGQAKPLASSLNFVNGQIIANAVTVKLGAGGQISIFNFSGNVDVVVDVVGYFSSGAGKAFHPLAPVRIQDSRPGGPQYGPYSTPWSSGTSRDVQVTGLAGVPNAADAVLMNVTATGTTAPSYLTVWPAATPKPLASSLNWSAGQIIPNAVTSKLGGGKIGVFNLTGNVDVIVDVGGYYL
jgi:hypothetical protein